METKMDPEVKAKWLAALRSGEYPQGKEQLLSPAGYCCLGVLCDLHRKEAPIERSWGPNDTYFGAISYLPREVNRWADLSSSNPRIPAEAVDSSRIKPPYQNDRFYSVSVLNDEGFTFSEIADLIEAHL